MLAAQLSGPLLLVPFVVAGILFVRAMPRVFNWCFLIGSIIQLLNSLIVPVFTFTRGLSASDHGEMAIVIWGSGMLGGALVAYGIIANAISYLRMSRHFDSLGFRKEDS